MVIPGTSGDEEVFMGAVFSASAPCSGGGEGSKARSHPTHPTHPTRKSSKPKASKASK